MLLDRGYESFWLFKLIMASNANFCARVSCNKLKVVKAFLQSGEPDRIVKLSCTPIRLANAPNSNWIKNR